MSVHRLPSGTNHDHVGQKFNGDIAVVVVVEPDMNIHPQPPNGHVRYDEELDSN